MSVILFFAYLVYFINLIGKKIIILEIASFTAILTWLIAPIPFYHFFNETNLLARKWVIFMPISTNEYYSFALPATLAMIGGLSFKFSNNAVLSNTDHLFLRINEAMRNKTIVGLVLIFIGFMSSLVSPYVPGSVTFIFYLLSNVGFVGLLYLYFSEIRFKRTALFIGFTILMANAISSGMFGILIYMLILVGLLILSNKKLPFYLKAAMFILGIYFVLLIQLVKGEYRAVAWYKGANTSYFGQLILEKLKNPFDVYEEEVVFKLMTRLNQGWHIARTMYHVPKDKPYANGETIATAIASTIVPRFLWPDKPMAGGLYNLERFWGLKIKGYSMNLGPIGEAYGNFGRYGAIVFMFFYGLFLNKILNVVLGFSKINPTWIIWLPFLFLYAIGTETDVVTTLNYLVKSFLFLFLFRIIFFEFFRVKL